MPVNTMADYSSRLLDDFLQLLAASIDIFI